MAKEFHNEKTTAKLLRFDPDVLHTAAAIADKYHLPFNSAVQMCVIKQGELELAHTAKRSK